MKKSETKEVTSSGASGSFIQPLGVKQETNEKWSEKYKKSINCKNPKGFSQRAHCQGRKKKEAKEVTGTGGAGSFVGPIAFKDSEFLRKSLKENLTESERTALAKLRDLSKKYACKGTKNCTDKERIEKVHQELKKQYDMGLKIEKEHKSGDPKQIVIDHLSEDPKYYTKLKKVETKEATGASSSGSYESPAFGAKSMSPKDWRGASKTQFPGGKFVEVKSKCNKFPYCNQGIDAINLTESKKTIESIIGRISEKYNIDKEIIKNIISKELRKN